MIDFPDAPILNQKVTAPNGQVWTWDGVAWSLAPPIPPPTGGGFTYVQDTRPTPTREGETWFDLSTAVSGGTAWVAVEESPGGEKVWVQFTPGAPTTTPWTPLPLYAGWANYGAGFRPGEYRKIGDKVTLRGLVIAPATGMNNTIAIMPAGTLPTYSDIFMVQTSLPTYTQAGQRCDITPAGYLNLGITPTASMWVSLSGFEYSIL